MNNLQNQRQHCLKPVSCMGLSMRSKYFTPCNHCTSKSEQCKSRGLGC
uniref:Uncharacterized protein n=1 Tax=Arundo donax TaxID=35708 RepID=A0A0A9ED87_ARUDO